MDSQARHIQARQVLRTGEPYAAISNSPASVGLATLSKQSKSARQPSRVVFDPRTDWEIWLIGLPPKPAWTNLERELWFRAALGVDHVSGRHGFSHLTLAANIGGRRRLIEAVPGQHCPASGTQQIQSSSVCQDRTPPSGAVRSLSRRVHTACAEDVGPAVRTRQDLAPRPVSELGNLLRGSDEGTTCRSV